MMQKARTIPLSEVVQVDNAILTHGQIRGELSTLTRLASSLLTNGYEGRGVQTIVTRHIRHPCCARRGDGHTLVDCLLHQMHLMPSDVIQPYPRRGPGFNCCRLLDMSRGHQSTERQMHTTALRP